MKTTKRPYTPVRVMDMLTEIKILCKRNQFVPKNFSQKEPSIWNFVRVLVSKGVLSKNNGVYKWIGGEPTFEMSKAVMEQVQAYARVRTEESRLRKKNTEKFLNDLNNQNVIESLDVQEIEYPNEHSIQNNKNVIVEIPMTNAERLTSYYSLSQELELKNSELEEQILAIKKENDDLFKQNRKLDSVYSENGQLRLIGKKNTAQLIKYNSYITQLNKEISEYREKISTLSFRNKKLEKQLEEIKGKHSVGLQQEIEEMKKLIEVKTKSRKVKLFGITIFKIE